MDLESPTLHYYFTNIILKNLILEQYEYYKYLISLGPDIFNESLRQNWNILAERTDYFDAGQEILSEDVFAFDVIDQGEVPIIFLMFLPIAKAAPEAYMVLTILYEDYARMFLLGKSDLHLALQAAGAPAEYCKPFFMMEELTQNEHTAIGRIETAEGFVEAVMAIARGEEV